MKISGSGKQAVYCCLTCTPPGNPPAGLFPFQYFFSFLTFLIFLSFIYLFTLMIQIIDYEKKKKKNTFSSFLKKIKTINYKGFAIPVIFIAILIMM